MLFNYNTSFLFIGKLLVRLILRRNYLFQFFIKICFTTIIWTKWYNTHDWTGIFYSFNKTIKLLLTCATTQIHLNNYTCCIINSLFPEKVISENLSYQKYYIYLIDNITIYNLIFCFTNIGNQTLANIHF